MAARKKTQNSMSLFGAAKSESTSAEIAPEIARVVGSAASPVMGRQEVRDTPPGVQGGELAERSKLRLVPPPAEAPESDVIVEPIGDGRFVVSLLRDHGTTVASVRYTRAQLEMLLRRIPAALEVG